MYICAAGAKIFQTSLKYESKQSVLAKIFLVCCKYIWWGSTLVGGYSPHSPPITTALCSCALLAVSLLHRGGDFMWDGCSELFVTSLGQCNSNFFVTFRLWPFCDVALTVPLQFVPFTFGPLRCYLLNSTHWYSATKIGLTEIMPIHYNLLHLLSFNPSLSTHCIRLTYIPLTEVRPTKLRHTEIQHIALYPLSFDWLRSNPLKIGTEIDFSKSNLSELNVMGWISVDQNSAGGISVGRM